VNADWAPGCHGEEAELLEYLRSLGATPAQIDAAREEDSLPGLAADLLLAPSEHVTTAELARRTGTDEQTVRRIFGLLGLDTAHLDDLLTAGDEAVVRLAQRSAEQPTMAIDEVLRVIGTASARVADAGVTAYVRSVEGALAASGATQRQLAVAAREAAELGVALGAVLGPVFLHHLRAAVGWQRRVMTGVTDRGTARVAVGFVDLVGFTPMSQRLRPAELGELVSRVEGAAYDIVTTSRGRLIKHIGDEVMFGCTSVDDACKVALALVDAFTIDGVEPRGGLCFGEVLTRHGDFYGPVVNLAARLTDLAVPGEILVDDSVTLASDGATQFVPAGRRVVKGFDEPVRVHTVDRQPA